MTSGDNDRIAYLAGEDVESLSGEDRAELDQLRALLADASIWVQPDPDLEDRVVATIVAEATPTRTPSRARRAFRFRAPRLALAGLAAAAAVVAIVVGITLRSGSPAPLHFAIVVSGTSLAPGAHGSAQLTKTASGWRIELSVRGLPHLAGTSYYEAWLKNAAGVLVPIGTFNDAVKVTLWSGVPVTGFRSLTVTVQQVGGNPASSGRRVLTGTIH